MTQTLREQIERRLAFDLEKAQRVANISAINFVNGATWQHAQSTEGLAELIDEMSAYLPDECLTRTRLQDWLKQKDGA